LDIRYWRTSTGFEVDFILGDMQVAVEVKGSKIVHETHTRALRALIEEHTVRKGYCCLPRKISEKAWIRAGGVALARFFGKVMVRWNRRLKIY